MAASMIIIIIGEGGGRNEPGALLNIINAARFEQFVNERILELRIVCVAKKNSFTNVPIFPFIFSPFESLFKFKFKKLERTSIRYRKSVTGETKARNKIPSLEQCT